MKVINLNLTTKDKTLLNNFKNVFSLIVASIVNFIQKTETEHESLK